MRIQPFAVEIWMNAHETRCELNLAETCVESLTTAELLGLAGLDASALGELLPMKLTYGAIQGSERLRRAIAALYESQAAENVIVAHGAAGANMLAHQALVSAGDRVVSLMPNYQQHTAIPESFGADLHLLSLREADGFLPDLGALRELAADAKLIVFSNPNNPTGALMNRAMLESVAAIADSVGAWVLADEVYRGIDQEGSGFTASIADIYPKGVSTGSMSKAYSLAGLRLGWIAAPREVIEAVSLHRDYSTISVGMVDDWLAALALENRDAVLARSRAITRENLAILAEWVEGEPSVRWVEPSSGTTALLGYDLATPSEALCLRLLAETGVLLVPGACFGMERTVRIGYANNAAVLREGLSRLSGFLAKERERLAA